MCPHTSRVRSRLLSWPGEVNWGAPKDEWASPVDRVVGEQFLYTGPEVSTRGGRLKAWGHSMVHLGVTGAVVVLYMESNKDQRLITAYQGCVHADSDVWTAL